MYDQMTWTIIMLPSARIEYHVCVSLLKPFLVSQDH